MFGRRRKIELQRVAAVETRSLAEPTPYDFQVFGAVASAAGVSVTPASALRVPAVAAGVRAIAEAVGILPLHVFARTDNARQRDNTHPAYRLLNGDACPWMRGPQLREMITADAVAFGNGFAQIVRDNAGEPRELHRLHPSNVSVEIDANTSEPSYSVALASGGRRAVSFADMLHLRAPSSTSAHAMIGRSPLIEAKDAIGLLISMQAHACRLFANGARPSGLLSIAGKLGDGALARLKASWEAAHGGGKSGGTAVLEGDTKFEQLSFTSVEAQFLEIWAHSITEVARVLRVPPVLLMDYSRQTWANAETGGQQFLTYSLSPWLARWEAEVMLKLVSSDERDSIFVEHLPDALLRSDFATRATAYGQYRSMGVMTANEVRAGLNLPPIDGGDVLQNPYTSTTKTAPEGTPDA